MARKDSKGSGVSPALRTRLAQIRACEASGESLKAYAERQGISPSTLYEAKRQARRRGLLQAGGQGGKPRLAEPREIRPPRFVEAIARPSRGEPGPAWRLHFAGGEILEVRTPLAIEDALRLAEQLGGRR